jgi:hypothetical protein
MLVAERSVEIQLVSGSQLSKSVPIPESLQVIDEPTVKVSQGFGVMRVMTPKDGDKRIVWNSLSLPEIQDAKGMFDQLVAEGLVPYRVGVSGKATSEVMSEFDPRAEEIIFLPITMVAGG